MTADGPLDGAHIAEEELDVGGDGLILCPLEGGLRSIDGHHFAALFRQKSRVLAGAATEIQYSLGWSLGQHPTYQPLLLRKPLWPVDEFAGDNVGARVAVGIGHLGWIRAEMLHETELQLDRFGHHVWVPWQVT